MATNGTSQDQTELFTNDQEASGQSIFWALAAIVLNAMVQPSFCGYFWSGDVFEGSVWPHRSSPTICLLDAIAETWIMVDKYRNPGQGSEEATAAKPVDVTMRLAIFVLAVLPQAVKLFSMRGIPVTQAVAAVFLVSTIVSMTRATCMNAPHKDVWKLVDRLKAGNKNSPAMVAIAVLGWFLHGIALFGLWFRISGEVTITTTEDITNAVHWVSALISTVNSVYILQHTAFILAGRRPLIPPYPVVMLLIYTNNFGISDLVLAPEVRWEKKAIHRWTFALVSLLNVSLCSYGIAYILDMSSKVILNWSRNQQFAADSQFEMAIPTVEVSDRLGTTEITTGDAQCTAATASQSQSTADSDLPPTYDQTTLTTTAEVPSASRAADFQETVPEAGSVSADQSTNENTSTPSSHLDNTSSTARRTGMHKSTNDETFAPSSANTCPDDDSSPETNHDDLPFYLKILVWIGVLWLVVLWYGELFPPKADSDEDTAQQSAAEQGTVEQQVEAEPKTRTTRQSLWRLTRAVNKPFRLLVRLVILFAARLCRSFMSLFNSTCNWIGHIVGRQSKDTLMVSFGIINFATAIVYYMTQFDGTGTFTPRWTTILG